jgi:hypothetical protein
MVAVLLIAEKRYILYRQLSVQREGELPVDRSKAVTRIEDPLYAPTGRAAIGSLVQRVETASPRRGISGQEPQTPGDHIGIVTVNDQPERRRLAAKEQDRRREKAQQREPRGNGSDPDNGNVAAGQGGGVANDANGPGMYRHASLFLPGRRDVSVSVEKKLHG